MTVVFKDAYKTYDNRNYYYVPNEGVLAWRNLLKRIPIYRAAAICSSGEIGLFSILPLVRRELVLVDHSYGSLKVAMMKYILLEIKGAEETYRLFTRASENELLGEVMKLRHLLPDRVCASDVSMVSKGAQYRYKKEWNNIPQKLSKKAVTKLGRVRFVHGDIMDLAEEGKFGLLYISNALEHLNRHRESLIIRIEQIESLINPGGYVVIATHPNDNYENKLLAKRGWKLIDSVIFDGSISWAQSLYKPPVVA